MPSSLPSIERARPLLGTTVAIRVHGMDEKDAHAAINEAFEDIALIHRLMSFHEPESDVSRLNRDAADQALEVHPATFDVLTRAAEMSRLSDGCFDITVAPELVGRGILPAMSTRHPADPEATWHDICLEPNRRVRFRRPLWIDLGGIAKGYAVDRAMERLRARGAVQACVNAGGDLLVYGPDMERVLLTPGEFPDDALPVLEIENAAVASSGCSSQPRDTGQPHESHIDGRSRQPIERGRFVSVLAEHCVVADALTKVVLALQEQSEPLLRRCGASAHLHDSRHGWRHFAA
jgi:thiamine biosynthesis lipoprotein